MKRQRKVFGIGLSRTGTSSLTQALTMLGYKSLHWPYDARTRSELMRYYSDRSSRLELTVARRYDAVTDTPIATVYRELFHEYPDSRFVLTVREQNAWLESCRRFWSTVVKWQYADANDPDYARYCRAVNAEVYGRPDFDRDCFKKAYEAHTRSVLAWFKNAADRLLMLDICGGQGWPELCAFLGLALPKRAFPHLNSGAPPENAGGRG